MTARQQEIESITDAMYYYMLELVSLANRLEAINLAKDGDDLRSISDDLNRLAIRIMNRKRKPKKESAPSASN